MISAWRSLRAPFTLPEGLHRCEFDDWEPFECDMAGCVLCGAVHRCDPNLCPLVCTEGRQVCEITGYCVKNAVFMAEALPSTCFLKGGRSAEFEEHNELMIAPARRAGARRALGGGGDHHGGSNGNPHNNCNNDNNSNNASSASCERRKPRDEAISMSQRRSMALNEEQVHEWIRDVLCSKRTRAALITERDKRLTRLTSLFTKLVRHTRSRGRAVNLIAVCTAMAGATTTVRTPRLLDASVLDALTLRCRDAIAYFLWRFLDALPAAIPAIKMRGFVVGLLYLMRSGICLCDSVEILPRVSELAEALPLENQLQPCFRLSTKIITEAENTIKHTLRGRNRGGLEALGFPVY